MMNMKMILMRINNDKVSLFFFPPLSLIQRKARKLTNLNEILALEVEERKIFKQLADEDKQLIN